LRQKDCCFLFFFQKNEKPDKRYYAANKRYEAVAALTAAFHKFCLKPGSRLCFRGSPLMPVGLWALAALSGQGFFPISL
jgi:hypothetical protein